MLLERAGLREQFQTIYSVEADCRHKSKNGPEAFIEVAEMLGVDPKRIAYIGDSLDEAKWAPLVFSQAFIRPHKVLGRLQTSIGFFLQSQESIAGYHSQGSFVRDLRDIRFPN